MTIALTSNAFPAGGKVPAKYTGEGADVSPPLAWTAVPPGTKEFALICDDPDAPRATPWVHWVLYKIPPGATGLAEGSAGGGTEGKNDFGRTAYGGPMPPPGHGVHHYYFRLYALGVALDLKPGATKAQLLKAMKGHVLAEGELIGTYERK
ncbi:MAG: YbhB/YbcL family Raf kinase inhibitor-like protein [Planctomycetes bacterium]|nr:YbhB/YbcL family Raf kinase inhibitor-like protein [Planctomycetota bacterium]